MPELGPVPWPPAPIRNERLTLGEAEDRDRETFIGRFAPPEVRTRMPESPDPAPVAPTGRRRTPGARA